jgi:NAD(P)-dependent dehydrogenase (short-subunit alcohol dehydrogenase family)
MRTILVTGASKGIGLAIARGILTEHDDTRVLLGARDRERGEAAIRTLSTAQPAFRERLELVLLDVGEDESVSDAAAAVRNMLGAGGSIFAVVNNAGVGGGKQQLQAVLNVNTLGVRRVCEGLLPFIDAERGRIVNVTSAAGPNFVAKCSDEWRRFFLDGGTEWAALEALMQECLALDGDPAAFEKRGLGDGNAYGLSKACTNTYTLQLARRYPNLSINACTPGFIETDMTRGYASSQGKTPGELGMKTPDDGARCPLHLLFGELDGNGRYYGSDCKRSPLDRYREPGSPPYTGD